ISETEELVGLRVEITGFQSANGRKAKDGGSRTPAFGAERGQLAEVGCLACVVGYAAVQAEPERGRDEVTVHSLGSLHAVRRDSDWLRQVTLSARLYTLLTTMLLHPVIW